ncbi:helix-turn-helix transcriptional regulator [Paraburkholderia sp. CNPSo 3281]|uniref:AraC family transcriptional regulator n=1 Tax=Paraburkholderia sp. CNPSo 3281 TaxID=2940933 RepID=UPI0020B77FE7|nr:helix-turn-helix transcriptional regulator [Paraburkholderia sp. CNPSo 3281]MCP3714074.1 helix-turn-helix transcriptional regulator [Paraburkholderia sp. CNPSo 3281]
MKSTNRDDYQTISRPVGAMAKEFERGAVSGLHRHPRAQLLYAPVGVMEIRVGNRSWFASPHRAMWIPAECEHEVHFKTATSVRTLYVDPASLPAGAGALPGTIDVTSLLRELILRAVEMPVEYDAAGRDGQIASLALAEIEWSTARPLVLPVLSDTRLLAMQRELEQTPSDPRTLEQWASALNSSVRTLARAFRAQAGMTFGQWRQHMRVHAALPRLASGEPVTTVALDLGYDSASAFAAVFRRIMGVVPSRYFQTEHEPRTDHRRAGTLRIM